MSQQPSTNPPIGLPKPQRHFATAAVVLAVAISVMSMSITNLALPTIARDLTVPPHQIVWVVNAYLVTLIAFIIPLSVVGERLGFVRLFRAGITIFMLGSLLSALASSLPLLLAGRVLSGLGGAVMMSVFGALMRHIYPPEDLAYGISLNVLTVGLSSVASPVIGATLLSVGSWHWVFIFPMFLCLATLGFSRYLPRIPRINTPFDFIGAILNVLCMGSIIVALDVVLSQPKLGTALFVLALCTGTIMWRRAAKQTAPLFPVDLFRIDTFKYAVIVSALCFCAVTATLLALPFFYEEVMGLSTSQVGWLFMSWPVATILMAQPAAKLTKKYPASILAAIGSCLMTLGMLLLLLLPSTANPLWYALMMFVASLGFGFIQTPNNRSILLSTPIQRSGATGAVQSSTRVFGQSLGAALVAICLHLMGSDGARVALGLAAAIAAISALVNLLRFYRGKDIHVI